MTNREKYAAEIRIALSQNTFAEFYDKYIHPVYRSGEFHLLRHHERAIYTALWLDEEYTEPEVDWSKVAVDTPIFVRDNKDVIWAKRYFARFENGKVYAWDNRRTGWIYNYDRSHTTPWNCAKLAEVNNEFEK